MNINKKYPAFLLPISIYFFLLFAVYFFSVQIKPQNARFNDFYFSLRYIICGKMPVAPVFIIYNLDDMFASKMEINDLNRKIYSDVFSVLEKADAKTILFDMLLSTPISEHEDRAIADAVDSSGNVVCFFLVKPAAENTETVMTDKWLETVVFHPRILHPGTPQTVQPYFLPFPGLQEAVCGAGASTDISDQDSVIRNTPLLYAYDTGYVPLLVLSVICHYYEVPLENLIIDFGRNILLPGASVAPGIREDIKIPVDRHGRMIINFVGPWMNSFASFSWDNLLPASSENREQFLKRTHKEKLVVLSDISTAKRDFSPGIFDKRYPNSSVVVNALNTIITGNFFKFPNFYQIMIFPALLLGANCLFFALYRFPVFRKKAVWICFFAFQVIGVFFYNFILFLLYIFPASLFNYIMGIISILLGYIYFKFFLQRPISRKELDPSGNTGDYIEETARIEYILKEKYQLTGKETEVALLLLTGKLYKEISIALNIRESAVRIRVHKFYTKCGVGNKLEFSNLIRGDIANPK